MASITYQACKRSYSQRPNKNFSLFHASASSYVYVNDSGMQRSIIGQVPNKRDEF